MKKAIRYILLTVCVCVFCYSAYNLIQIYLNYKKIDDDYGEIAKTYTEEKVEEKESYLQINWDELLQRNKDVKAWIQIPNTNVNYPVLQGETNDTYIHSDIDHNELSAGSIFIASENEDPFNDFNTVIYGHNMKNGSMFNNIKSYTDQSFADEHPYTKSSTVTSNTKANLAISSILCSKESSLSIESIFAFDTPDNLDNSSTVKFFSCLRNFKFL